MLLRRWMCLFFLLVGLAACNTQPETAESTLPLSPCRLAGTVEALCGTYTVYENREAGNGRTIDLNIAVLPATSNTPQPDPLFMLAGGPGQAATEGFPLALSLLDGLTEERDIVLVDQRGTGASNSLACPNLLEADMTEADEDTFIQLMAECRTSLDADLTQYVTEIAMADLDEVRAALGYEQINLYGVSYGTRAALTYLRLYPQHTRSVVLDAVVGQDLVLYLQMPQDGQRALELLFARCAADTGCNEQFPNLADEFVTLLDRLASPVDISVADPISGEMIEVTLTRDLLTQFIFNLLYSPEFVSLLPLLIHTAHETEDFAPLVSQAFIFSNDLSLAHGMLYSVTCTEDAPLFSLDEAKTQQEGTVFPLMAEQFLQICADWPKGQVSADFRQPVQSDVPVLLISGDADPVTPPSYAAEVAETLPNSLHINLPKFGHGVLAAGCMPTVVTMFIEAGTTAGLDTSCLETAVPPPFFVTFAGPLP